MNKVPPENSDYLVDGKYGINDLVDLKRLQSIFDKFTLATGFTIGFLDHPGLNILAMSGWREICTKFHRGCKASEEICTSSNRKLLQALNLPNQTLIEPCEHGLIDCATPIIIKGKHIASLATGQLLMAPPDMDHFKKQARIYGYDEAEYIKALQEIPVVLEKDLHNVTAFMGEIASLISEMGYSNLLIKEEAEQLEIEFSKHKHLELELKESVIRYAALFQGAVEGILVADIETKRLIFANPAICNMLGYTAEELTKLSVMDIHPHDSLVRVLDFFEAQIRGKISEPVEHPCLKKDGTIIYADIIANSIIINNQQLAVGFFADITERKRLNDKLNDSLAKLQLTIDEAPVCVITTGFDRRFLSCNKAFCNFLGYSEEELKLKTFTEVTFSEDVDVGISDIKPILDGIKKNSIIQKRYVRKDGSIVWAEVYINLIRNNLSQPLYFLSIILDITERKGTEYALSESELRYKTLFKTSPSGILVLDENGIIIEANEEIFKSTIYSLDELIGQHVTILSSLENLPIVNKNIQRILAGEILEEEVVNYTKDGTFRIFMLREAAITLPNGQRGVLSVSNDITERKMDEDIIKQKSKEIEKQNEEYKRINIELQVAKEKAEESDRLKSAFLANMSHEIRTPMNGILSFAGLLKSPELTGEKQKEYVRIIESSGDRMLNIINDLISISKIEAGMTEVIFSNSSINEQIEYIYYFFKPEVEKKGMKLNYKTTLPTKESIIYTDREKIYAILTNLVKNALKFTREGSIEFGYEKKGDLLEFFVKDTGIGISDDQKKFIFERFRQGSESLSRNYEGAGLGLSISKLYVEMLGGKIWLESELCVGSKFYFTTPYVSKIDSRSSVADVVSKKKSENTIQKLKVLIAEDDETSDMFLTITLQKYSPEILHTTTGHEAVEICRNNPDINLVLMDIKLSEMDGYEATQQIRKFNKDVIIIAQTAYAIAGDREKSIKAGCNDHITKPINTDRLLAIMEKYFKL
jgi:PAS domain S-box-containing protein